MLGGSGPRVSAATGEKVIALATDEQPDVILAKVLESTLEQERPRL